VAALQDPSIARSDLVVSELIELAEVLEGRCARGEITRAAMRSTLVRWSGADAEVLQRAARRAFHEHNTAVSDCLAECVAMLQTHGPSFSDARIGSVIPLR